MTNTKSKKSIADDAVVRRLYARGIWKLKSAAHFGGDETGIADMCLLRDEEDKPFIPGASIAGAARSFLARQSEPWGEYKKGNESQALKRLFGGAEKDDTMSALIVADAACVPEQVTTLIRDGVRVDAQSGSAAAGAKFDVEVLERGAEFLLNLECTIRKGDNQSKLEELFFALLHGFKQGDIYLGARTRRGYGRGQVSSWDIRNLEMKEQQHVMAWLRGDVWNTNQGKKKLPPNLLTTDQRTFFRIEADFQLRTSLLIRSSSGNPDDPDMVHLHSNDKPVVPGTSFAGAFRQRASLIANALDWHQNNNDEDAVCEMFGPIHKQDNNTKQQKDLWASRVTVEERLVEKVKPQWQDRVAIDRFTGGSLQSALFNEKPVYPCSLKTQTETNVRLRLTLEEPEKAEIGLLLLTLRDFWYGNAALGGETSIGRGTLQGIEAKLIYKDTPNPSNKKTWKLSCNGKCMTIEKDDESFLQSCVEEAQNYSNCPSGSRRPREEKMGESDAE